MSKDTDEKEAATCTWTLPEFNRWTKNQLKAEAALRNLTLTALVENVIAEWLESNRRTGK